MTSTFFRGLSGSDVSVFFILRFRICFEENYDEVDGRSSSFSFWLLQALLLQPIFFYPCCLFFSGTDRASLGLTTTFFLALIFFFLLYSSPFFFHDRSYSKPCLFSPSLFRYEDDRRLNS